MRLPVKYKTTYAVHIYVKVLQLGVKPIYYLFHCLVVLK